MQGAKRAIEKSWTKKVPPLELNVTLGFHIKYVTAASKISLVQVSGCVA